MTPLSLETDFREELPLVIVEIMELGKKNIVGYLRKIKIERIERKLRELKLKELIEN